MADIESLSQRATDLDPTAPEHLARKDYVDDGLGAKQPLDADLTAIAALAPADGSLIQRISGVWNSQTAAQVKASMSLVKADVGLGSVDNTADTAKPVSSAQQTALDAKQNTSAKGQSSGYCELDSSALVPRARYYLATAGADGTIRLAGDLGGSGTAPTVPGLSGKAATVHTHAQADVTSLVTDLSGKASTSHTHSEIASKLVPATTRSCANPGPGGAVSGLVTNAGATAYVLTELNPPVLHQNKLRLRYWNGRTFDGSPGEVDGPNSVTLRASVWYPCGVWRQISGNTAWASGTTYNAGDMVTNAGKVWVAYNPPITVGVAPSEGAQWHECIEYPVAFPGDDANRRVALAGGDYIDSEDIDLGDNLLLPGLSPYLGVITTYETGSASNQWMPGDWSGIGDFVVHYAGTGNVPTPGSATDPVDSGFTNQTNAAAGTAMPMPSVIYAPMNPNEAPPVVALVGDSSLQGNGDAFIGYYGWAKRSLENYSFLRLVQGGRQAAHFDSAHAFHDVMLDGCDAAIVTFGGNELGNSKSLATIQAELVSAWKTIRARGIRVWATTVHPITTSTDSWATVANQTAYNASFGTAGTTYANLIKWLRDGAPVDANGSKYRAGMPGHPLHGVLETVAPVVDPTSPWKWRAPGYTADGAHGSALMAQVLAAWSKPWMPTVAFGVDRSPLSAVAMNHVSGWSIPPEFADSQIANPTSGTIHLAKMYWPGGTIYQLHCWVVTAGVSLTANQSWMGVYTLDGTLIGRTATQHTAWQTSGDKTAALQAAVWAPAGELYLAWVSNAATTRPRFGSTTSGANNSNLPTRTSRAVTGPTGQTTLPDTISLESMSVFGSVIYGAAS